MRAGGIGPYRPLGDVASQLHHSLAQRGQGDGGKFSGLAHMTMQVIDELADIPQWLADFEVQAIIGRPMTDADAKAEAAPRQFVDERGSLGIVSRMARIDIGNARPKGNIVRHQGERFAQPHAVPKTGAVYPTKAFVLDTLCQLKGRLTSPGHSSQADGGFGWHVYL